MRSSIAACLVLVCLSLVSRLDAGYLTAKNIETIKAHWQDYAYAAELVGVPVEILPAIHYRESDLRLGWYSAKRRVVAPNLGGPFMLDRGGEGPEFPRRIREYEIKLFRKYEGDGVVPRVQDNFQFAAVVAAHELKSKMRGKGLADAVWGYNGRSKLSTFQENAYLWNHPKKRPRMLAKYRFKGEQVIYFDDRPGVMVLYAEIIRLRKEGKL